MAESRPLLMAGMGRKQTFANLPEAVCPSGGAGAASTPATMEAALGLAA